MKNSPGFGRGQVADSASAHVSRGRETQALAWVTSRHGSVSQLEAWRGQIAGLVAQL
ncbi:hypothetical protein BH23ACI1_BH23ACI1_12390 [soil metagenome]